MDTLTVLVIAVVVFAVFVLLTAYFLKMATSMGSESGKIRNSKESDICDLPDEDKKKDKR
ncbi:hypothetical protein [Methanolobus halotolerans]|uniref:Uncharacterized protein n=1 Tax=Methanolobus halotolerans TaxID=2052935 RepID=A0A4E0PWI9_9EURY|nr:hypothetical protein [Methanolobus halotolerans]TGC09835.1 hypothetical protein CUN85_05650 [Methanolobus halotolerans]